jgi:uncharacterized protein (DUF433 family)
MTAEKKAVLAGLIAIDAEVMHGTPCFAGTRVPIQTLIDFLETERTVDDFLSVYPYILKENVHAFLELSKELVVEQLACVSS